MNATPSDRLCADQRLEGAETVWQTEIRTRKRRTDCLSLLPEDLGREIESELAKKEKDTFKDKVKPFEIDLTGYELADKRALTVDLLRPAVGRDINYDLRGANLFGVDFSGLSMSDAQFQGAMLCKAKFGIKGLSQFTLAKAANEWGMEVSAATSADVSGADFRDADLGDADLSHAVGLVSDMLAGCRLSNAKLPADVARFDRLAHIEKASISIRTTFLTLVVACLYCWITVAATKDVDLITNRATYLLPVTAVTIYSNWFFLVAPLVVLSIFLYMQLNLQSLWQDVSKLPAIFPDGEALARISHQRIGVGEVQA